MKKILLLAFFVSFLASAEKMSTREELIGIVKCVGDISVKKGHSPELMVGMALHKGGMIEGGGNLTSFYFVDASGQLKKRSLMDGKETTKVVEGACSEESALAEIYRDLLYSNIYKLPLSSIPESCKVSSFFVNMFNSDPPMGGTGNNAKH